MDWASLLSTLGASGPLGVICLILLWRDNKRDERKDAIEKERIEADKDLARSLAILAERIK